MAFRHNIWDGRLRKDEDIRQKIKSYYNRGSEEIEHDFGNYFKSGSFGKKISKSQNLFNQ